MGKTKVGSDKYPKNLAGSRPIGEIREEEMPIKGEDATTKWGVGKYYEKNLGKKYRESHIVFFLFSLTPNTSGKWFVHPRTSHLNPYFLN